MTLLIPPTPGRSIVKRVDKMVENATGPHTQIAKAYYEGAYLAFDKKLNKWKP